jgi:hypothetical protein
VLRGKVTPLTFRPGDDPSDPPTETLLFVIGALAFALIAAMAVLTDRLCEITHRSLQKVRWALGGQRAQRGLDAEAILWRHRHDFTGD